MFGIGKRTDLFEACFGPSAPRAAPPRQGPPVIAVSSLPNYRVSYDHGEKFPGGLGPVELLYTDYWALRARSTELFERNHYARGLIRRLVTNVINTGLHLEATPEEKILGFEEDALADWSEDIENRFSIWTKNPYLCDHAERRSFGQLQVEAFREALVAGDVLCVLRQDQRTKLPRLQIISGTAVQTPLDLPAANSGAKIRHGVELDALDRHVAYWVRQEDGTAKRLPAYGEKSGRRIAWLLYATDKRLEDVRGKPLLALVLQSLKEIDRFRDSTQRKALINSMWAFFIKKTEERFGTRPTLGGATRVGSEKTIDSTGEERSFSVAENMPGAVFDELQYGEEPEVFKTDGTVENFGTFEQAILASIAWANEIPPEILTLSFNSNYSASQAAINEFKLLLNTARTKFGEEFCSPIYEEWLLSQVLAGRVTARGFAEAFRDIQQYDTYGAWISSDWSGHIKPAVDLSKLVRGYREQIEEGLITRDRASRELNGSKYTKNVQKLKRENEQLAEAKRPLLEVDALIKARNQPLPPEPEEDDERSPEQAQRVLRLAPKS